MKWLCLIFLSLTVEAGCNCMCDDGAIFYTNQPSTSILGDYTFDSFVAQEPSEPEPQEAEVITIGANRPRKQVEVVICDYDHNGNLVCRNL